jgi:hypothetical protein
MGTALATVEAVTPLARREPLPLPDWVSNLRRNIISRVTTSDSITLRCATPLTTEQRNSIEAAREALAKQLEMTPAKFPEYEEAMLNALGELMLARPHRASDGALRSEALVRSFGYALDDIPVWATLRAIANWHRDKVESYDDPNKYNTRWMPEPIDLRCIAKRYVKTVRERVECFDDILRATPEGSTYPLHQWPPDRDATGCRQIGDVITAIGL